MQYAVQDTVMIGNQRCPKILRVQGKVQAGDSLTGKAIFVGNSYLSPVFDFDLAANESQNFEVVRPLNWPTQMAPTLAIGPGAPNTELKTMALQQGFNITYGAEQKVLMFPRQTINLSCEIPTYTPAVQGPGQIQMLPNHTGGGGSPTDLQQLPQQPTPIVPKTPTNRLPTPGKSVQPLNPAKPQAVNPRGEPQKLQEIQKKSKQTE